MKKSFLFFTLLLGICVGTAQKKDKIKGSKIVTIAQKKIEPFSSIEVADNLEVMLIKGNECGIEIEADDNLHDIIDFSLSGSTLKLGTLKEAMAFKKLSIRLTYTDDFKMITLRNEVQLTALSDLDLDEMTIKSFDYAKVYANAQVTHFTLECNDKSKGELKLQSEKAVINLSKNAALKAWITAKDLNFDMYQKTEATIEGDVADLKLRLDNNAAFTGKNLTAQNATVVAEGYTNSTVNIQQNATIDASVKAEIELYGEPKIEMKRFTDSAVLRKKPLK